MTKIDLMIVGAQKAGTTSFKQYLGEHPLITTHGQMEFDYFVSDERYQAGFEASFDLYFRGNGYNPQQKLVAKSAALYSSEKAIQRLYEHNPDCKLIYLVREPASRAYSSYAMERTNGGLQKEFDEIVKVLEEERYDDLMYKIFIDLGLYARHLKNIYRYFPKSSVKIFLLEDMRLKAEALCSEAFAWIGVDDSFIPDCNKKYNQSFTAKSQHLSHAHLKLQSSSLNRIAKQILPSKLYNEVVLRLREFIKSGKKYEPMSHDTNAFLKSFFAPHNRELEELSGVNLDVWE